jgi:TetR/AcrR family transcriptional regulator, transcriptional repressor for nem operon
MARTRAFDEAGVLEAVGQKFRDSGYAATSLDEIMRASGLGKGSLYGAFGNKHSIFLRTFDAYCAEVTTGLGQVLAGPAESAFTRLSSVILGSADASAEPAVRRACFLAKTTAELAGSDPEVAAKARSAFRSLADSLTACIGQAQDAGDIDGAADPAALGNFVLAVLRGNEALAESRIDPQVLHDAATTAIAALRNR